MSHWSRNILRLFLLALLAWAAGLYVFIGLIPKVPAVDAGKSDAIVVLTGGSQRLERGFSLLAQGRAPRIFISGVEENITLASLLRNKDLRPYTQHLAAGSSIALGHKARSTFGNAEETAQWAAQEHIHSIRLVTGNYHIPRSLYELHESAPDLIIIPDPVFPNSGLHYFMLVCSEYNKFMASLIRHRLADLGMYGHS